MLDKILQLRNRENSVNEFVESVRQGIPSAVFGVSDSFKNYLVSVLENKVLFIVKDGVKARAFTEGIRELSGKKVVYIPAKDEILLHSKAFSKDNSFERIRALAEASTAKVIITTLEALMQIVPKKINQFALEKNQAVSQSDLLKQFVLLGYTRVETVSNKGSFALRGDILDVYPINSDNPIRVDFFGDTVVSIKNYDVETRENLGFIENTSIIQATEFTFFNDNFFDFKEIIKNEIKKAGKNASSRLITIADDLEVAMENKDLDGLSVLAPLSVDKGSVFNYLTKDTVVVIDECKQVNEVATLNQTEFTERYASLLSAGEIFSFSENSFLGLDKVISLIKEFKNVAMQTLSTSIPFFNPLKIINPQTGSVADYQLDFKEVFTDISNWLKTGYSVTVCALDLKKAENFCYELSTRNIASSINGSKLQGVNIITEKLGRGFIFHEEKVVVIGSGNLFVKPISARKIKAKNKFFTAPEVGEYCVHEVHGVGRVLGNKKITSTEGTKDYVAVEYSGGDVLYVPVEQMDILTRYLGGEKKPKLSRIGGKDFEHLKNRIKESIKKMSFDLKKLYQEREELKGYKFSDDDELQNVFESAFPFEDTPDQTLACADIKGDMISGKVMDRLVCGDVGFGKTEVAFRAVFRAIVGGKQAVMLAPTTILAEQHFNTAKERFKDFGIKIACLNRFKTPKEQRAIIDGLKQGKIDFVIGTHRLLSKDIGFKDLGILVLDEEQRFGVEHKERIKLLKKNVHAITLTATPIPRTLHMSLSGIRSISTINTPPKKRLPVQTYVTEESETLIKDAILKEVNRGGQAFILYNRVESIFTFADSIKRLMPTLRITVVHGQMEERVMERNILAFYRGEYDLLISTTIIENGIDLPKANTLIVIDADRLGLSTLYQLKGRVGRSDRLAYAYFTFKREKILSESAYERLNAIIEFTEMGSGIKIAMRDLEIRGAGNILGAEQHGHMDKIGYELYSKLLREELSGKEEIVPELDIRVTAFIPDDYIEGNVARMDAYKEIAEIDSLFAEKEFRLAITENYGAIPEETDNLINIAVVKRLAMQFFVKEINIRMSDVCLVFNDFSVFADERLNIALENYKEIANIVMTTAPMIEFKRNGETSPEMLKKVKDFLTVACENK